jgi:hypothetical protein
MVGETKVLGEELFVCHFAHHNSHMLRPGIGPGPPEPREIVRLKRRIDGLWM